MDGLAAQQVILTAVRSSLLSDSAVIHPNIRMEIPPVRNDLHFFGDEVLVLNGHKLFLSTNAASDKNWKYDCTDNGACESVSRKSTQAAAAFTILLFAASA